MTTPSIIFFALFVTQVHMQTIEPELADLSETDQLATSLPSADDVSPSAEHVSVIVMGTGGVRRLATQSERSLTEPPSVEYTLHTTQAISFVAKSMTDESAASNSSASVFVSSKGDLGTAQHISSSDSSVADDSADLPPSVSVITSSKGNIGPRQYISSADNSTADDSADVTSASVITSSEGNIGTMQRISSSDISVADDSTNVPSASVVTSAKDIPDTTESTSSVSYPTADETTGNPPTSAIVLDNHINNSKEVDLSCINETTVTSSAVVVSNESLAESSVASLETRTNEMFSVNGTDYTAADDANANSEPANGTLPQTEDNALNYNADTVNSETPITDHVSQTSRASASYSKAIAGGGAADGEEPINYTWSEQTEVTERADETWNVTASAVITTEELRTHDRTEDESVIGNVEVSTLSEGELGTNVTSSADVTVSLSSDDDVPQEAFSVTYSEADAITVAADTLSRTEWADLDHDTATSSMTNVTADVTDTTPSVQKGVFLNKVIPSTKKKAEPEPATEAVTKKAAYHKPVKDDTNVMKFVPEVMEVTAVVPSTSTWSPPLYVTLIMKITVEEFRTKEKVLRADISRLMREQFDDIDISEKQVVILAQGIRTGEDKHEQKTERLKRSSENSEVQVYIEDGKGYYSYSLTKQLMGLFVDRGIGAFKGTGWQELIIDMKFHGSKGLENMSIEDSNKSSQPHVGILVAIVIGVIAATVVLAFIILQLVIFKRRRRMKKMRHSCDNHYSVDTLQALNLDNIQLTSIRMTGNRWGAYINPALVIDDKDTGSNPLSFTALSNIVKDEKAMEEEFMMLPNYVAKMADIPAGAEDKNRYANVIPVPETRVPLMTATEKNPAAGYINANFVRGYLCAPHSYIATQAPMKNTVEDFWRMVFEQKSQAILMLTALEENGSPRCVEYWPNTDGGDMKWKFGEFEVTLLKRDIKHEWITSVLRLKHLSKTTNQYLDIYHFWLTSWPDAGLPDSKTLLGYLIHARPYMEQSIGPTVVHCSSGTGRTGVVLAVDIQMLSYDDSKLVDVLSCVCGLRQDRAGLVQTKEQYKLIYRAVFEYAQALNSVSRNPSRASSYNSIQIVH